MRRSAPTLLPAVFGVAALCLAASAWRPPGRVLLVGIDGASMRVAGPLLAEGRLANLKRIADAGASGELRSALPLFSPRIWATIATGKVPEKHGIRAFAFQDEDGEKQLYLSVHRKARALWNIVSERGGTVGVVNWWNTYPPEAVRGVVVSDHAMPNYRDRLARLNGVEREYSGPVVFPPEWAERAERGYVSSEPLTDLQNGFENDSGLVAWVEAEVLVRLWNEDAATTRIALDIERAVRPDLLMVLLPGIDRVSHHLWGALEPPDAYPEHLHLGDAERARGREALLRYYEYTDRLIGLLLSRYGPEDLVIVLSDHGFEAGTSLGTLTGMHVSERAAHGVLFARGPGIPAGSDTRGIGVNDVAPTVLAWMGLPVADDMDGAPAPFLEPRRPVERIASYDVGTFEVPGPVPSGREDEILDQLRDLGYVE